MSNKTITSQPASLDPALRDDVRLLGELLGAVIERDRGAAFLAQIESIRALAKAARADGPAGPEADWTTLGRFLVDIIDADLVDVARAFNQFLILANIAEQNHQARQTQTGLQLPEVADCVCLANAAAALRIELVLTAHPTEVLRRTLIQKYDAIAAALAAPTPLDRKLLERLISEAWHSDEIRQTRPTPQDEAKWGYAVIEQSLWVALPAVVRNLNATLEAQGLERLPLTAAPLRFASWMGGDRDGNPNVTAEVTREVVMLGRWMAADLLIRDIESLQASLSMVDCDTRLRELVGDAPEPYRALMKSLRERLIATRTWAEALDPMPPLDTNLIILDAAELASSLAIAYASLVNCGMQLIADGPLLDTLHRVAAFGLTLTTLDVRQNADEHTAALHELTQHLDVLGDGSGYRDWSEVVRCEFLTRELTSRRPLLPASWPMSAMTKEVLDTCRLLAQLNGVGISQYVISMASAPSDVLAVLLLLRETGLVARLPIVPLFETLTDLETAADTLAALLAIPWYANYIDGAQQVMIGYSDSAKDAGQLAAAWAQYLAQERLVEVAQAHEVTLTLFHGRGGAVGRGGGPAQAAVRSQPPGSVNGRLRVTEQGEMIRWKFGTTAIAISSLEGYISATLEATLQPPDSPAPHWRDTMTQMADAAVAAYRSTVRDNDKFVGLFRSLTPERELGILALGSRPARRAATDDVASLRAIPWVFAWTQVRLMLPAWLGTDAGLASGMAAGVASVQDMLNWPFFAMQMDMLEMVLAKADPDLTDYYAARLVDEDDAELVLQMRGQLQGLVQTLLQLRGATHLLERNPELAVSLAVRNTYLDPLHLLQAELLGRYRSATGDQEQVAQALRVTMAGISSGLRNTG